MKQPTASDLATELENVIKSGRRLTSYAHSVITLGSGTKDGLRSLVQDFEEVSDHATALLRAAESP